MKNKLVTQNQKNVLKILLKKLNYPYIEKFYEMLEDHPVTADLLRITVEKETRFFTREEREHAANGLELMTNIPQLSFNNLNNKLTTSNLKPILILCDGIKIDEVDLMGLRQEDIVRVEFFATPPARYRNLGVEAVLLVITKRSKEKGGYLMTNLKNGFTTGYGTDIIHLAENAETAMITTLGNKLEPYRTDMETIGVQVHLDKLLEANTIFAQLETECREIVSARSFANILPVSTVRKQIDPVYHDIINAFNTFIRLNGEETYQLLVTEVNTLVDKYDTLLAQRKGRTKKEVAETEASK
jgi:hypothetical protein